MIVAIQASVRLPRSIKTAADAEQEIEEATFSHIIMATLWILTVKCKLRKSLKKRPCASTVDKPPRAPSISHSEFN